MHGDEVGVLDGRALDVGVADDAPQLLAVVLDARRVGEHGDVGVRRGGRVGDLEKENRGLAQRCAYLGDLAQIFLSASLQMGSLTLKLYHVGILGTNSGP